MTSFFRELRRRNVLTATLLIVGGVALGFYIGQRENQSSLDSAIRTQTTIRPGSESRIAPAELKELRDDLYADITTIAQVMELPTDFSQSEATYVIAGRAEERALRRLIAETAEVLSPNDERAARGILFSRYGDLDPESAIAHLRELAPLYKLDIFFTIVNSWAKHDLDGALAFTNRLTDRDESSVAGTAIMRAFDNPSEELIQSLVARLPVEGEFYPSRSSMARRAAENPQAALDDALAIQSSSIRAQSLRLVGDVWASTDPQAAFSYANNIGSAGGRKDFLAGVIIRWMNTDPDALLHAIATVRPDDIREVLGSALLNNRSLASQQQLAFAMRIDNASLRDFAIQNVVQVWSRQEPGSAALAVERLTIDDSLRRALTMTVANGLAIVAPDAALAWIERIEGRRGQRWERVLRQVATLDPRVALDAVLSIENKAEHDRYLASIVGQIASSDPQLALSSLDRLTGEPRQTSIRAIAGGWARHDPDAAMNWVATLGSQEQSRIYSTLASTIALNDAELAASYLPRIPAESRQTWINAVSGAYVRQSPDAAQAWIGQFANEPQYDAILTNFLQQLSSSSPQDAARMSSAIVDTQLRSQALRNIARSWAIERPAEAAAWVGTLPGDDMTGLVTQVVQHWSNYDRISAETWVIGLPTAAARDEGLMLLAGTSQGNLDEAIRLISNIQSEEQRMQAARRQMEQQIRNQNVIGARTLIAQIALSPRSREALLAQLQSSPEPVNRPPEPFRSPRGR